MKETLFLKRKSEDTFNASNQAEVAMIDKMIMLLLTIAIVAIALKLYS